MTSTEETVEYIKNRIKIFLEEDSTGNTYIQDPFQNNKGGYVTRVALGAPMKADIYQPGIHDEGTIHIQPLAFSLLTTPPVVRFLRSTNLVGILRAIR